MTSRLAGFRGGKYLIGQKVDISVVPLVGVMLVLLIVFIVSGPIATAAITADNPPSDSFGFALRGAPPPTFLSVMSGGVIYLTDQPTSLARLDADLKRSLARSHQSSRTVYIRADRRVRYGDFVAVVNQLQRDGYTFSILNEDLSV